MKYLICRECVGEIIKGKKIMHPCLRRIYHDFKYKIHTCKKKREFPNWQEITSKEWHEENNKITLYSRIEDVCNKLSLSNDVKKLTFEVINSIKNKLKSRWNMRCIISGALYICAVIHRDKITQKEIVGVTGCSVVSLRKYRKKIYDDLIVDEMKYKLYKIYGG